MAIGCVHIWKKDKKNDLKKAHLNNGTLMCWKNWLHSAFSPSKYGSHYNFKWLMHDIHAYTKSKSKWNAQAEVKKKMWTHASSMSLVAFSLDLLWSTITARIICLVICAAKQNYYSIFVVFVRSACALHQQTRNYSNWQGSHSYTCILISLMENKHQNWYCISLRRSTMQ